MRPGGVTSSVAPRWHPGGHMADRNLRSALHRRRGFEAKGPTREAKPSEVVSRVDPSRGCAPRPMFRGTTHSRSRLRPTGDAHADSRSRADNVVSPMFPGPNAVTSKPMPNEPDLSNLSKSGLRTSAMPLLLVNRALTAAAHSRIDTRHPVLETSPAFRSPATEAGPVLAERQIP